MEGASTREIAKAAKTAMSSITYHYGGKEGLHVAAARHISAKIRERFPPSLSALRAPATLSVAEAIDEILLLFDPYLAIMVAPEAESWSRFMGREQFEPGDAFDILWEQLFSGFALRLTGLVARAGAGRWENEEVRIRSLTLMGQVLVFRNARANVLRMTGWSEITSQRASAIRKVVQANVRSMLK